MLRPQTVDLAVEKLYRLFGFTLFLEHSTAKVEISIDLEKHRILGNGTLYLCQGPSKWDINPQLA